MPTPKSIFILAGESSGDLLGASVLHDLTALREIRVTGVGGPALTGQGMTSLFPMDDLAVMGFVDVIGRLPKLLARASQVVRHILSDPPDLVLLVDAQEFSTRIARDLRKSGYRGPILLYVAPSVWAWRPKRAPRLVGLFDEVLAILPFEPRIMAELGGPPTSYVGHPLLATTAAVDAWPPLPETGPLLLLPGSRGGEVKRHLPYFKALAAHFESHPRVTGFVLPTLPHLADRIAAEIETWPTPVDLVLDRNAREKAYAESLAAIATAGTVTLELALRGIPFEGLHVPDWLQMQLFKRAGFPMVGLPNIIAGHEIARETRPGPDLLARVITTVSALIETSGARQIQREAFARVREILEQGEPGWPRYAAAERVIVHLDKS